MERFRSRLYLAWLIVISFILFVGHYTGARTELFLWDVVFWSLLGMVSETFLIVLPSGASTSVGMAVYLAAMVTAGPLTAMIAALLAFIFRMPTVSGTRKNILTLKKSDTIFNATNHVIALGVIGYVFMAIVGDHGSSARITLASLLVLMLSELMSILMVSAYFYCLQEPIDLLQVKNFFKAMPSTWAVGALGLILAFSKIEYGYVGVAFIFIPLQLARYSFKLYFDSQRTGQETIEALNAAMNYRDAYTSGHTERVEAYTVALAKAMNYSGKDLQRIKMAARLHDIGKIGVPDRILNKAEPLTDEEYEKIKDHAAMGEKILSNVDSLKRIAEVVRQHHERPDGKGYPDGLTGEAISMDAAILSIADTYDAMTSKRPYREAMSHEYAVSELRKYRGVQFRSDLVEVFIEALSAMPEVQGDNHISTTNPTSKE